MPATVKDESSLDANVLPAVIAILAAAGGESEYAEFRDRFKSARTPQEEQRYLYALARLPSGRAPRPNARDGPQR
jgi:hypothetical protein